MKILIHIWKVLDGNKSIISSTIPTLIYGMIKFEIIHETKFWLFIAWFFTACLPPSLVHHVKKGYLKKDKGN
jgi:hypothetical protein